MSTPLALIIEDHEDQAEIMARALQLAGFSAEVARTGNEALAKLATSRPALVLLDLNLPDISGTSILFQIRSEPRLRGTRIIVATLEPQVSELVRQRADAVLVKPLDLVQLCNLATRLCAI
ncbi:MAG: response regulator [Anaerolineae bacterium]|nr:response regulator [Anaerolineae bacterium]